MTSAISQVHHQLKAQASRAREQAQHAPRPARIRLSVNTRGIGETRLLGRKRVEFGALLIEEPSFSWGVEAGQPIASGELPMCTAIVLAYIKNQNGLYTAAEMGFRVDSTNINIRLKFSLTFEASTMRSNAGTGTIGTGDGAANAGSAVFRQYQ